MRTAGIKGTQAIKQVVQNSVGLEVDEAARFEIGYFK